MEIVRGNRRGFPSGTSEWPGFTHLGEVVPKLRVPLKRAGCSLEVDRFAREPGEPVAPVNEGEVGRTPSVYRGQWYSGLIRVADLLDTELAAQLRTNSPSLVGRRARELNLSPDPKQPKKTRCAASSRASTEEVADEDTVACGVMMAVLSCFADVPRGASESGGCKGECAVSARRCVFFLASSRDGRMASLGGL